jgi:hypothetical protein
LELRTVDRDRLEGTLSVRNLPSHVAEQYFSCSSSGSLLLVELNGQQAARNCAVRLAQGVNQIVGRCGLLAAPSEKHTDSVRPTVHLKMRTPTCLPVIGAAELSAHQ